MSSVIQEICPNIPGINIRTFPLNEAKIVCRFELSYGDALELCKRTPSGLAQNKDLQDWLQGTLVAEFEKSIEQMREKRGCQVK